jgi:cytochrome c5
MSARRLVALLLVAAALAGAQRAAEPQGSGGEAAPADTAVRRAAYAATLPDSAGKSIAERWCVLCHSAMLITQQAKDSTGWEKTISQMEKWGVVLTPEEHDTLRTYLQRSFGPRPVPAPRARPAPAPAATTPH